jgi:hypothetical protein
LTRSAPDSDLTCVALRATDYARQLYTSLTYTQAGTLGVSAYEPGVSTIWEATEEVTISGAAADYYNSFPLNIDFEGTPIQGCAVQFQSDAPPSRAITLKAKSHQISHLSLQGQSDGPVPLAFADSSKPLSLKAITIGRNWQLSPDDLNWDSLEYIEYPFSSPAAWGQRSSRVAAQVITYVNKPSTLGGQTVQLQARGLTYGGTPFSVPGDADRFSLELQIGGTGESIPSSTGGGSSDDSVQWGTLVFSGSVPDPAGEYILDFNSGYHSSGGSSSRLGLKSGSGWTAPPNLIIRARDIEFDATVDATKSFNFTLEGVRSLYLMPYEVSAVDPEVPASSTVQFTGVVDTSDLYIYKLPTTQVVFSHLTIARGGSAYSLDPFCSSATFGETCKGVDITNAYLSGGGIPFGCQLTGHVSVSGSVTINPAAFKAKSLSLDENAVLLFDGEAPAFTGDLVGTYNFTNLLRPAYQIVNDQNNSLHGEFNRTLHVTSRHICGRRFATCEAWKLNLKSTVTSADVRGGSKVSLSFYCGDDSSDGYAMIWPESGDYNDAAVKTNRQCLFAQLTFSGGDPTSPHYSAPSNSDDSGLSAGSAAAITLGVILFVVIVAVVLLIVLGKLAFTHGSDADP